MDYKTGTVLKINDRYEFLKILNVKPYTIEEMMKNIECTFENEEDIYESDNSSYEYVLKGITVHVGPADGGHYYAYINTNREEKDSNIKPQFDVDNWFMFENVVVKKCDYQTIEKEAFGGADRRGVVDDKNAYLLFYEKVNKSPIRIIEHKSFHKSNVVTVDENLSRRQVMKKFDVRRVDKEYTKEQLFDISIKNNGEYYRYIPSSSIQKLVNKEYYDEVLKENKVINKILNLGNKGGILKNKSIKELLNDIIANSEEYLNLEHEAQTDIINVIFSYVFGLNDSMKKEDLNEINNLLEKVMESFLIESVSDDYKLLNIDISESNISFVYNLRHQLLSDKNIEYFTKVLSQRRKTFRTSHCLLERLFLDILSTMEKPEFYMETNEQASKPTKFLYEFLAEEVKDEQTRDILISINIFSKLITLISRENNENRGQIYAILSEVIKSKEKLEEELKFLNPIDGNMSRLKDENLKLYNEICGAKDGVMDRWKIG